MKLRVVTYNIRGALGMDGLRSIRRIAEVLIEIDADVICLQEVHKRLPWSQFKDQPTVLARLLNKQVVFQSNYRVGFGGFGNAIVTSLPVVSHSNHRIPNENERRSILRKPEKRGILDVVVVAKSVPIAIMTTHWSLDPADRLASAPVVAARVKTYDMPVILGGDFNATPICPEMVALERQTGLKDAATSNPQPTFTSDMPTDRIDYFWLSSSIEVESVEVIHTPASDHLPLVLTLRAKCVT